MKNNLRFVFVVLFILIFVSIPKIIFAMKITEIMYDVPGTDSGREWIEVYNNTNETINFSNWKLLENSVNHTLKLITGSENIPSGGYAIIADNDKNFMTDNPDYSGTLFDSAFSLTNTGENLILVDSIGNHIDEISYNESLGAKGDGNSLQLNGDFLITAPATPGKINSTESALIDEVKPISTSTTISISAHSAPESVSKIKEVVDLEVFIGRDRISSIKAPILFEAKIQNNFDSKRIKYLWNFGDGEQIRGNKLKHYYKHPGNYNVVLNAFSNKKHAVARANVFVTEPKIRIKWSDLGLELENLDNNEINLGNWRIYSKDKIVNFTFPQDTIVSANTKIIFDKNLFIKKGQNENLTDLKLDLYFPNNDLATSTSDIIKEVKL